MIAYVEQLIISLSDAERALEQIMLKRLPVAQKKNLQIF